MSVGAASPQAQVAYDFGSGGQGGWSTFGQRYPGSDKQTGIYQNSQNIMRKKSSIGRKPEEAIYVQNSKNLVENANSYAFICKDEKNWLKKCVNDPRNSNNMESCDKWMSVVKQCQAKHDLPKSDSSNSVNSLVSGNSNVSGNYFTSKKISTGHYL